MIPTAAAYAEYLWLSDQNDPDRTVRFRKVMVEAEQLRISPWVIGDLAFWLLKLGEETILAAASTAHITRP